MIATLAEWERFDAAAPAPSFFSRPAFARALGAAWSHVQAAPLAIDHQGERFVVPMVRARNRLGLTSAVGFPLGAYSSVLDECGRPASEDAAGAVFERMRTAFDLVDLVPWPLGAQPHARDAHTEAHTTAVIDCSGGMHAILSGMRGVARRTAGQAARRGLRCRRSPPDAGALDRYYRMLEESSRRWERGAPTIPFSLLQAVFAYGGDDTELWFAYGGDECIAGCVALFGRDELFVWTAAMRREFAAYRPSNALHLRLLERACERGIRWYNVGASAGASGVERFKRSLGAIDVEYASLHARSTRARAYMRLRAALSNGACA